MCVCVCVCVYVYIYIYMCVCVCVYMYESGLKGSKSHQDFRLVMYISPLFRVSPAYKLRQKSEFVF